MIPYLPPPHLQLGPISMDGFGLFVALGVWLATVVLVREARREGLALEPLQKLVPWAVGGGVVGGHLFHLFLYHPEELALGPLQILKVWDGLSSTGGLLGGLGATLVFLRRRRLAFATYTDALAVAVSLGWAVARIGCFVVHDHPGVRTTFPLAVAFPGGARHDLGLDDALLLFALYGGVALCRHRHWLVHRLLGLLALGYGMGRFGLDFLRAQDLAYVDKRYLGLTPAQYVCVGLVVYGLVRVTRKVPSNSARLG